ncbi:hypothetical protein fugu_008009 [Takifugu bimaculatus]|uniref:Suppressor of cytokine signaling 1 n=1 Tax=Takifugu bimaculatus TaxID=433685 RepID=A0A4Z2B2D5_9TELE|nr:hypothetical protein fugu_008009 [Takifugu bimaculatus]
MPTSPVKTRIPLTSFGHLITEVKKQLFGIEAPAPVELTGWRKHLNSYTLQGRRNERRNSAEKELEFLQWNKLSFEEEAETWEENVNGADASSLPTHLRPFSSLAQYKLVRTTYVQLLHSDYYWRSMTMEEAHRILASAQLGTFLIRDSCQPDIFFTLSYQSDEGPISIRIQLNDLLFSLCGSQRTFTSLFSLLAYYSSSSCKLTTPYRKQRPELLKQMCRRALIRTYRAEDLNSLPGLSKIKDYVLAYPYCI